MNTEEIHRKKSKNNIIFLTPFIYVALKRDVTRLPFLSFSEGGALEPVLIAFIL